MEGVPDSRYKYDSLMAKLNKYWCFLGNYDPIHDRGSSQIRKNSSNDLNESFSYTFILKAHQNPGGLKPYICISIHPLIWQMKRICNLVQILLYLNLNSYIDIQIRISLDVLCINT